MKFVLATCLLFVACTSDVQVFEVLESVPPALDGGMPMPDGSLPTPDADAGTLYPLRDLAFGAAFDHTCAAVSGATLCWGKNDRAQLGLGDTTARLSVERVAIDGYVLATCAGESHSCAVTKEGTLYCWGANDHGEVGVGDDTQRTRPAHVEGIGFSRIACGGDSTCGISLDGALYCWGDNFEGKLGQDDAFTSPDANSPTPVIPTLSFREVSVGQGHVCAIDSNAALYCWGRNSNGQLGLGSSSPQVRKPTLVATGVQYRAVAAAQHHTCAVRRDNVLECWGLNAEGELGTGAANGAVTQTPTPVSGDQGYRAVSSNWFNTCALRSDDSLWCWGRNAEGQLGLGDDMPRNVPTRVDAANTYRVVTSAHFHTCAFQSDGLYCWGENNEHGQLGLGEVGRKNTPTLVPLP